jgi:ABC-type multidrug transport system ATPase subunit
LLRTEGLTKRYEQLEAVVDLNLHVHKGETYGFLGPNGAGKTTTIMMLLGLEKPTAGKIRLFGQELNSDPLTIKRKIGVVLEHQYLYEEMTAMEYLRFFAKLYEVENPDQRICELLDRVQLLSRRDDLVGGYSRGMRQKLSVVRGLLHDPELLILDEPVSSLDPYGIKEVRDLIIEEQARGRTFFISSHILSEIEKTCSRVGIIHRGVLVAEDEMDSLKAKVQQERELIVELEAMEPGMEEAVRGLQFIQSLEVVDSKLFIKTDTEHDYRPKISRAIAGAGGTILSMQAKELSLEDAFVTITEKNLSLLTEEVSK